MRRGAVCQLGALFSTIQHYSALFSTAQRGLVPMAWSPWPGLHGRRGDPTSRALLGVCSVARIRVQRPISRAREGAHASSGGQCPVGCMPEHARTCIPTGAVHSLCSCPHNVWLSVVMKASHVHQTGLCTLILIMPEQCEVRTACHVDQKGPP